jgi:AraC-like DNA-binding protein
MAGDFHWHSYHESPIIAVGEYRCRYRFSGIGGEETTPWHSVVFVRSGVFVKHVGGKEVVADANQVLFFNAGEAYRVSHPVDGGDVCTSFALPWNTISDILSEHDPQAQDRPERPFRLTHGPSAPVDYRQYQRFLHAVEGAGAEPLAIDESALLLVAAVIGSICRLDRDRGAPARPATARCQREIVEATKLFISRHFRECLELNRIARSVHTSPYHLCRLFRRETGIAVHQYQNRLRLRAAVDRMRDSRLELTPLALDVGYFDLSHFSNAFRREFGVSPSDFRRACIPE